jgi:hypothetical protein
MTNDELQAAAARIVKEGPARVVINADGEAVPPKRAKSMGIVPHIILIRGDGWSLGAPEHFAAVAKSLWADEWVGFLKRGSRVAKPFKGK